MKRTAHILSYFSFPTDLAEAMRHWPEFISGEGYFVVLESVDATESVKVILGDNGEFECVILSGDGVGTLFDRVLEKVTSALAKNSDTVIVDRLDGGV